MKDDLINRQEAIDVLEERLQANGYSNVALVSELNRSIGYLMQLPSVQPWRKKGKWLTEYLDGIPGRRAEIKYCSECCQVSPYRHNFCPNCGADMRGE